MNVFVFQCIDKSKDSIEDSDALARIVAKFHLLQQNEILFYKAVSSLCVLVCRVRPVDLEVGQSIIARILSTFKV